MMKNFKYEFDKLIGQFKSKTYNFAYKNDDKSFHTFIIEIDQHPSLIHLTLGIRNTIRDTFVDQIKDGKYSRNNIL